MDLQRLHDAARSLGVSYPTLKQWIYNQKIRSVKTAGGHHRIPQDEIDRILGKPNLAENALRPAESVGLETISGRNKLSGRVIEVNYSGLLAQVVIDIGESQQIISIITGNSARDLNLRKGINVYALVKATEVMVVRG